MHYYQYDIGAYRKDASHLSLLEHGVYRQMLDQYYLNEGPLPKDKNQLMRSLCVRSADEVQAFENVLADFFELTESGYVQQGCEKELARIYEKSDKARAAAAARWENKNKVKQRYNGDGNADAMQTHNGCSADGMPPIDSITQDPIDTEEPPPPKKRGAFSINTFLEECKAKGESQLPVDSGPMKYAESIGLPVGFVKIAWGEFVEKHQESGKRQLNWRQHFLNCLRNNWYKLWWRDEASGDWGLTTAGKQAAIRHKVTI